MTIRGWRRRWRHRRSWKKAERNEEGPLREFTYMDEVSVYSLVASQVGLLVTELTETQASSLQSEVSAGFGLSGPLKADVGSKIQAGETQTSQVLRKAIIQTTFKQLHETATRSGALRLRVPDGAAPEVRSLDDVRRIAQDRPHSPHVIAPHRLRRGDLIEMEVTLEAEPIFQAGAVISGLLEIIQDDPAAFGVHDMSELAQTRLVSRMVDKVLAGLVPLRGRSMTYSAVEIDGEEWVLHVDVIAALPEALTTTPLFLVGVAQQDLFWKDVRRVLFSDSSFRVLGRLNRTDVQETWTAVKLVDVVRDVMPEFADVMDTVNRGVLSAMSSAVAAREHAAPNERVRAATITYATLLADRAGVDVSEAELEQAGLFSHEVTDLEANVRVWREMLAPVTKLVEEKAGQTFEPEVASDYRVAAITRAGLLEPAASVVNFDVGPDELPERFLDCEIVAIYW